MALLGTGMRMEQTDKSCAHKIHNIKATSRTQTEERSAVEDRRL